MKEHIKLALMPCGVRELTTLESDALHVDGLTPAATAHIALAKLTLQTVPLNFPFLTRSSCPTHST